MIYVFFYHDIDTNFHRRLAKTNLRLETRGVHTVGSTLQTESF